jgi:4-amino-4-deoxy-L-arabinose transferase-like glycosyltransferase
MFLIPLMDVDAAQYASISREMLERNSFLQVFDLGKDYLDKPPMLFWLSALSMKIFGIYDWSYRLPSILLMIVSIYATYQLAIIYYEKTVAQLSAIVLASLQALFLMSHDVRTDTLLMSWVILGIWQLAKWYQLNKWTHFFLAFIFIGCGMMTKGPIALMVPGFAFLSHFVAQRNWKQLFRWEYLLGVIVIAIMLIPMSIGLYQQFDLHPGKLINNVPIQSGLRFYYWTQSFGRYTGENVYHEMSYFSFLLENMLWSFLPWIVFFLLGIVFSLRELIIQKFLIRSDQEFITTGGFLLTYCILAKSQAQLPHYIFVVYPLAAITTARILYGLFFTDRLLAWRKPLQLFHLVIFALLWIALIGLMFIPFPEIPLFVKIISIIGFLVFIVLIFAQVKNFPKIIALGLYTVIGVNIFLSTAFYPNLLQFQMGNDANAFINKNAIDKNSVYLYGINNSNALHFYGKHIFVNLSATKAFEAHQIILTEKDSTQFFKNIFPSSKVIHEGNQYPVSVLTGTFLNPSTRMKEMPRYVMIDLDGKP